MHEWVLVVAAFVGAATQSVAGIGFGVVAGPLFFFLHGERAAVTEVAVYSGIVSSMLAVRYRRATDRRVVAWLLVGLPAGLVGGFAVRARAPLGTTSVAFGFLLLALGLFLFRSSARRPVARRRTLTAHRPMAIASGIMSGIATVLFAAPGPPAAFAVTLSGPADTDRLVGTTATFFALAYAAVVAVTATTGEPAMMSLPVAARTVLAAACGVVAGGICANRISRQWLIRSVALLTLASGLSLIVTQAWQSRG